MVPAMNADEAPLAARGFIARVVGTLLVLILLYVLSLGPVMYFEARRSLQRFGSRALPSFPKVYTPLLACASRTPLEMALLNYRSWCLQKAIQSRAEREKKPRR
jgi:hypothetical protein